MQWEQFHVVRLHVGKRRVLIQDPRRQVRNGNGEFRTEKEGQVQQTGPRPGRVTTGEAAESFIYDGLVRVGADGRGDQGPTRADVLSISTHNMGCQVCDVGLTASDEIWTRLSDDFFQALTNEESNRGCQSQPS